MEILKIIYLPVIAILNLGFIYLWNLKIRQRAFRSLEVWLLSVFGSVFNVWGLDVIQRELVVDSLFGMLKVSVACWLVFVLATGAKYIAVYGWSKRDFWLDCGGDLLSFIFAGILVYIAT